MKITGLLYVLFIVFPLITSAQLESPEVEKAKISYRRIKTAFFFQSSYHFGDYKDINSILTNNDFATFKESDYSFGAGMALQYKKLILQYAFYRMHQCVENNDEVCSHINFSSDGASIGFLVFEHKQNEKASHLFYPLAGISRNRTEFLIADNDMPSLSVGTYLTGFRNVSQVTRYNYMLNLQLAYDFKRSLSNTNNIDLLLGIRGGYSFNMTEGTWYEHEDEVPLTNGPKSNPAGGFIRIIGGLSF